MEEKKYDVAIIGAGPAGYVAAIKLASLGKSVACIEKRKELGGTCLNVGCIPSKALLDSSEHYEWIRKNAAEHGIAASASVDLLKMMQRKEGIVQGLNQGIVALFKRHKIDHVNALGSFLSPHTIALDNEAKGQIFAKNVIIATGSLPIELPFLPFDEKMIVSSTGALSLQEIPKRLVVIGAGAIGLELASVYQRLGSKVTIIEMLDAIAPGMDQSVSHGLLAALQTQGLTFHLSSKVLRGSKSEGEVSLIFEKEGNEEKIVADVVLVSVGRIPNTKSLNLEKAQVTTSKRGLIEVDANFKTSSPHIFAIGDVIDGPMLAHKASQEGEVVAELIAGKTATLNYMAIPSVVYTHPEAASVGMTEEEVKAAGIKAKVGISHFKNNGRARCSGDIQGFVKIVADAGNNRVLGMHILSKNASLLIAEGVLAIEKKAVCQDLANVPSAHPSLSEVVKEAAATCH